MNRFKLKVLEKKLLSNECEKSVFHISLDLGNSGIKYMPGDILRVHAENDPLLVKDIKNIYGKIEDIDRYDLSRVSSLLIRKVRDVSDEKDKEFLTNILSPNNFIDLRKFLASKNVPEILKKYGVIDKEDLIKCIQPLVPRSYSISSSQSYVANEVHLMVSLTTFDTSSGLRKGVASSYILERVEEGDMLEVSYKENNKFKLPDNDENILMIGPGTGLAPFIGFLQDRVVNKAKGKNWLFFGDRSEQNNFYYKTFLEDLVEKNILKLDLAFSRDQEDKEYVQCKMKESIDEIRKWLKDCYIYICGDKMMARDVEKLLIEILSKDNKDGKQLLSNLEKDGRYKKDVY